jgi:HEAT repeat protein
MTSGALLGLLCLVVVAWLASYLSMKSEVAVFQAAARELKLECRVSRLRGRCRIVGFVGRMAIEVESHSGDDRPVTRFRLKSNGEIPPRFGLRPEHPLIGRQKSSADEGVLTGDQVFDTNVHVSGPADLALALLDRDARAAVLDYVVRFKGQVGEGQLLVEYQEPIRDEATIVATVRTMTRVAGQLQSTSTADALRFNAENDPNPSVRRANFLALASHPAGRKEDVERLALGDPDAAHLLAGQGLFDTDQSREVLAKTIANPREPEAIRRTAFEFYLKKVPFQEAGEVVAQALDGRAPDLARTAVLAVGAHRSRARLVDVCALAANAPPTGLAQAIAEALGELRDPRAEDTLLSLVRREEPAVQRAAVAALARVGTIRAVEPLLPLARGLLVDQALKEDARKAVRWIQGRLAGGDAGALSVAEDFEAEGRLSIASGGGELSLAKKEKG